MGEKNYTQEIEQTIDGIRANVYLPGKRVFYYLRKLIKKAKELEDNKLLAFAYYYYALRCSYEEDHDLLIKYVTKAIYYLHRADDKDLLARSYNLFAFEALKNGCFDVAYDYFQLARTIVENDSDSVAYAMIQGNIGDCHAKTGDYKKAYYYTKKSLPIIKRHKEDPMYVRNVVLVMMNLGLIEISLGKIDQARAGLERMIKRVSKHKDEIGDDSELWLLLYSMRIAIIDKNKKELDRLYVEVRKKIIESPMFNELTKEVFDVCRSLIKTKQLKLAGDVIDAIDNVSGINDYAAMLFAQLKVEYFKAIGNKEKVLENYEKRQFFASRQEDIKKRTYYESIEIMRLLDELRKEQEGDREENTTLRRYAETDVLTGLPNRYAMNRHLEEAFVNALEKGECIGIGIIDIDNFKRFNDSYGHHRGDECLVEVGKELKKVAEKHGLNLFRYGGDEYVLIYENLEPAQIEAIEKELCNCKTASVTHGFYCAIPDENTMIWDFFSEADKTMFVRKRGKNGSR